MIGTHHIAAEFVRSNVGLLFDCVCCKVKDDGGGRPGTGRPPSQKQPEGPLVPTFVPVAEMDAYIPDSTLAQTNLKKRDILSKIQDISDRHHQPRSVQVVGLPGKASTVAGVDARLAVAFRKYLFSEEQEFLTLILAALEDDCCEC